VAAQPRSTIIKAVLALLFVLGLLVVLVLAKSAIAHALLQFMNWVVALGVVGKLVLIGCFIVASLPIPMLIGLLTLASGAAFGVPMGMMVVMIGCSFGSLLVFLASRFIFRERVEKWISTNAFFTRFNGRIEREGWKLALAMRLASVPFGMVNVFLAVTKLRLEMFVLTTVGGELPIAFIGTFLGSSMGSVGAAVSGEGAAPWTTGRIVFTVAEALLAVTFMVVALLVSRKMLMESPEDEAQIKTGLLAEQDEAVAQPYDLPPIETTREGGALADVVASAAAAGHSEEEAIEPAPLAKSRGGGDETIVSGFGTL
jgi:uncharacterized membrane protein YdjX (TVP38/TMEM64 family)